MSAPAHNAQRLKLPAYGRELLDLRRRGLVPARGWCFAHVLIVVDVWALGTGRTRLVIDPADDPAALDFRTLAGLDCVVCYDSRRSERSRVNAALRAVLAGSPNEVIAFDVAHSHAPRVVRAPALGLTAAALP
jgi:hypothetical protein